MTAYLKTSNTITILFLLLVGWHFGTVFGFFGVAPTGQTDVFLRLAIIIGGTMISAFIASYTFLSRNAYPLMPDEREEKIERVSEGIGVLMLYIGLIFLAWFAFAPLQPFEIVNGMLAVVAITELVKLLIVFVLHKREVI